MVRQQPHPGRLQRVEPELAWTDQQRPRGVVARGPTGVDPCGDPAAGLAGVWSDLPPLAMRWVCLAIGWMLLGGGALLASQALITLGVNLSPLPEPKAGIDLVSTGPYRLCRLRDGLSGGGGLPSCCHRGDAAFRLSDTAGILHGLLLLTLVLVLRGKAQREERRLLQMHPTYGPLFADSPADQRGGHGDPNHVELADLRTASLRRHLALNREVNTRRRSFISANGRLPANAAGSLSGHVAVTIEGTASRLGMADRLCSDSPGGGACAKPHPPQQSPKSGLEMSELLSCSGAIRALTIRSDGVAVASPISALIGDRVAEPHPVAWLVLIVLSAGVSFASPGQALTPMEDAAGWPSVQPVDPRWQPPGW